MYIYGNVCTKILILTMEYIEITRSKRKIAHDGYYYVKHKKLANGVVGNVKNVE